MSDERCKRENLVALLPAWDRWEVNEHGDPVRLVEVGRSKDSDIYEYECANCCAHFAPVGDSGSIELAWEAALDHLGKQAATAG